MANVMGVGDEDVTFPKALHASGILKSTCHLLSHLAFTIPTYVDYPILEKRE